MAFPPGEGAGVRALGSAAYQLCDWVGILPCLSFLSCKIGAEGRLHATAMRRNRVNTEKSLKDCLAHKRHFVIAVSGYSDGQGPTYTSRQLEVGGQTGPVCEPGSPASAYCGASLYADNLLWPWAVVADDEALERGGRVTERDPGPMAQTPHPDSSWGVSQGRGPSATRVTDVSNYGL